MAMSHGRAFLLGADARAVDVDATAVDDCTWRFTAVCQDLSPVVAYLLVGANGSLLIDPGSSVTWPGLLGAIARVRADLDIRWVFGHDAYPATLGALPLVEASFGSQAVVVTTPDLLPVLSHYGTRLPIEILPPGGRLDIGARCLVAETGVGPDPTCVLRDVQSGVVFGARTDPGDDHRLPAHLESVRANLEDVLLTTLAPIALEGRALAALAPVGRITAVRTYVQDQGTWFELGGRGGIRGRVVAQLPPDTSRTVRVVLPDPAPITLDLRFASESAHVVEDPDVRRMIDSLRRPLATAMRRVLSMRDSILTNSQLRADVRRDPLTGVGNRRALAQWTTRHPFAALMIDLDYFKQINDQVGHRSGDAVLRLVAEVIGSQIRPHDLLVRYGGDEFLLLLDGADCGVAQAVAARIRTSVATLDCTAITPAGHLSVSIGVAAGDGDLDEVIARADVALYEAKAAGRDTVRAASGTRSTVGSSSGAGTGRGNGSRSDAGTHSVTETGTERPAAASLTS